MPDTNIHLRGVRVHNLRDVDLDLPRNRLIVFCGVSGSGKTSLALDTLYAEGQRRYIECFSAYTRQFLEQLDKPEADRIDGIPAAVAVTRSSPSRSTRATVGTATETTDYLRLLFARIGQTYCRGCGELVRAETPDSLTQWIAGLPPSTRLMVGFPLASTQAASNGGELDRLREEGFLRVIAGERMLRLDEPDVGHLVQGGEGVRCVVVDRLKAGESDPRRIRDSLETAFRGGAGQVVLLTEQFSANGAPRWTVDGAPWLAWTFSSKFQCGRCGREYPRPEPQLFNFNSPWGACPTCEGFGNLIELDMERIVPDPGKTLEEGAIAPWNTPAYRHELDELLALAPDYGIPVDVPFRELQLEHVQLIRRGVPERKFGGLDGFFRWLEKRKYKMHLRVFLSRWRSARRCPDCDGSRLRPEALAARVGGRNIAEVHRMRVSEAIEWIRNLDLSAWQRQVGRMMLEQVEARLGYLEAVGLGYLTLDRMLRTLSGGEAQRVMMTAALGASLVNMLYVLDEPSVGLHPADTDRLLAALEKLRDRGNTVVVVEHEEKVIRAADHVVEIGPGAGNNGGQVVFSGTVDELLECETSLTAEYLTGKRGNGHTCRRRPTSHGWLKLTGASGHNLRGISVEFPLGVLCVVTGVSGAGKSSLVEQTLYPALCRRKRKDAAKPLPYDDIIGDGQIDDIMLIDQSPIGRSPRSNPITYIKAFDAIRAVFAETLEARTRNLGPSHFSFNVDGGRCSTCQGDGYIQIDMQFLADVYQRCRQCHGTRYRREVLEVTYRGRNIAEVLQMTVREAFGFFRGQTKVQSKLKQLIDVGLDYLRLGQPANTLSSGEAQRLKLASYLSSAKRARTLFVMDEPTTGLHFSDIVRLLDCFEALLANGHSLLVIEHNLQLIRAADYIIDLGPGAADKGGTVVVQGTPEVVARHQKSITGRHLAPMLAGA